MFESQTPNTPQESVISSPKPGFAWYRDIMLLPIIAVVMALDQFTKYLVRANMQLGESWPAEGLFRITHGVNTGTAFGLFPDQTVFLIVASIIAMGFLVYFYRAHAFSKPILRLAIGLQLGGAFGNLIDRLRTGAVVDFIELGWWPIFNLADSSIVIGMTLLVAVLVLSDRKSLLAGKGARQSAPANTPSKDETISQ
jgi:signal peptidase II